MIVKHGKVKITGTIQTGMERVKVLNIIEKSESDYVETLTELESMEVRDTVSGEVYDSSSELGNGYRVFPMKNAEQKITSFKDSSADTVEWVTPLTEVT